MACSQRGMAVSEGCGIALEGKGREVKHMSIRVGRNWKFRRPETEPPILTDSEISSSPDRLRIYLPHFQRSNCSSFLYCTVPLYLFWIWLKISLGLNELELQKCSRGEFELQMDLSLERSSNKPALLHPLIDHMITNHLCDSDFRDQFLRNVAHLYHLLRIPN